MEPARIAAALATALVPALPLAQQAVDPRGSDRAVWYWVWGIAALIAVIVLLRTWFGRERRGRSGPP